MVFCQYVSIVWSVSTSIDGGDLQSLIAMIKFV